MTQALLPAGVRAAQAVEAVLAEVAAGTPGLLVEAAAGAGKTTLIAQMSTLAVRVRRDRVLVAAYTRSQRNELLRRLGRRSQVSVWAFIGSRDRLPDDLSTLGIRVARTPRDLPQGPALVVSTVTKAALSGLPAGAFGWLMLDEAYQVPAYLFLSVATLALRVAAVGDPAQIDPVIRADATRWAADPNGPHRAAPWMLRVHPAVVQLGLPVSRRLVADTVGIVGPTFYPDLMMQAIDDRTTRAFRCAGATSDEAVDRTLRRIDAGASVAALELPIRSRALRGDEGMRDALVALAARALELRAGIVEAGAEQALRARDIGVVCTHIEQVTLVQAALRLAGLGEVRCETANRWQGEERTLMLVWHPLTGQRLVESFAADAGRWCVGLTRHRGACIVVQREGMEQALDRANPGDPPPLLQDQDPAWSGIRAHRQILGMLRDDDRVISA